MFESRDAASEFGGGGVVPRCRDDGAWCAQDPPSGSRSGYAKTGRDGHVACVLHKPNETVVVGALLALGFHPRIVRRRARLGQEVEKRRPYPRRELERNMQNVVAHSSAKLLEKTTHRGLRSRNDRPGNVGPPSPGRPRSLLGAKGRG